MIFLAVKNSLDTNNLRYERSWRGRIEQNTDFVRRGKLGKGWYMCSFKKNHSLYSSEYKGLNRIYKPLCEVFFVDADSLGK